MIVKRGRKESCTQTVTVTVFEMSRFLHARVMMTARMVALITAMATEAVAAMMMVVLPGL